jgi:hypothetical protein
MNSNLEVNDMAHTLVEELDALHDDYVVAVNEAVAANDLARVERLAADYDHDATTLVAEREGRTHLLPLVRARQQRSALRRLARRGRAAA